ncbi:MAG: 1-acyl-sn-glycerol-3-phosphate acyltransferase [Phycisphaerae bacterium]|nr:1-acyl-sn-glycerol-3-phosphate acyltransferase [Phycisphaerae bacterium]
MTDGPQREQHERIGTWPNPRLPGWRLAEGVQKPSLLYRFGRRLLQVGVSALWSTRVFNRGAEPTSGGVVYICNHQSFLDPVLMSFALRRPVNYMARDSLFRTPGFKQLITSLNAFPVRRGTADLAALKEAMRRLKAGGQVVVFAEGTRTLDGRIGPLLPGVAMLAQRAADWTIPVVIDGAYECWPRTQAVPSPGFISVQYAKAIPQEEARQHKPETFMTAVRETLIQTQHDLRRRTGRAVFTYD